MKRKRSLVKRILLGLLIVVVLVAGAAAGFGMYALNRIREPYKGFSEPERFVDIPAGSGAAEIRRRLIDAGVVSDEWAFRAALQWTGQARALKAGEPRCIADAGNFARSRVSPRMRRCRCCPNQGGRSLPPMSPISMRAISTPSAP